LNCCLSRPPLPDSRFRAFALSRSLSQPPPAHVAGVNPNRGRATAVRSEIAVRSVCLKPFSRCFRTCSRVTSSRQSVSAIPSPTVPTNLSLKRPPGNRTTSPYLWHNQPLGTRLPAPNAPFRFKRPSKAQTNGKGVSSPSFLHQLCGCPAKTSARARSLHEAFPHVKQVA